MFIVSLITGGLAWLLAGVGIAVKNRGLRVAFIIFSFLFCGATGVCLLLEVAGRIRVGDFAGVEDTLRAILIEAVAVFAGTVLLNAVALKRLSRTD